MLAVIVVLVLGDVPASAEARELAVEPAAMVEVEVAGVSVGPGGSPVVLLREPGAREAVPVFIGTAEAEAILRGMREARLPRPLTHDLFADVLEGVDARLVRVYIDDFRDGTYLGMLELRVGEGDDPVRVDSRSSDAIALALRAGAPIFAAPRVLAMERVRIAGERDPAAALGLTVAPATESMREVLELPGEGGVLVSSVNGPAEAAGLRPGALVLEVNGNPVASPREFLGQVRETPRDAPVTLHYWQDGEEATVEVSLEAQAPVRDAPPEHRL